MPIGSAGAGEDKKLEAVIKRLQEHQDSIDGTIDCVIRMFLASWGAETLRNENPENENVNRTQRIGGSSRSLSL
jgi:chorismate synthase